MFSSDTRSTHAAGFWVALALMIVIVIAGLGGAARSTDRILLEQALLAHGIEANAEVLSVSGSGMFTGRDATDAYRLRYRYDAAGQSHTREVRVRGERFSGVASGRSIVIRYLPRTPGRGLPVPTGMSELFGVFALFGLVSGLAALIVLVLMIVSRLRKQST